MYLEHFGLTEPPFKITPVTEFFFSGANRGEILDALIYVITDSEGIIKISGEVGSGKTMLCRMLLDRLPSNIKAIYLSNPSLSRDELLYAIADGLELDLDGQRVSVLLQNLHNHLVEKHNQGERCVVLVDEAHAMPLDTLEELRLLYNLQVGKNKLIQIVLFGQPELDEKLEQTNMRQLKDRIVHHFNMQPLSKKVIESYLMFRMRAAGYHGPDIFSAAAVKLIGKASNGLMRRVNILADKSLLAAFVENTHNIEVKHVHAAIRDSEISPNKHWLKNKNTALAGAAVALAIVIAGAGWLIGKTNFAPNSTASSTTIETPQPPVANAATTTPSAVSAVAVTPLPAESATVAVPDSTDSTSPNVNLALDQSLSISVPEKGTLLQQRLAATKSMLHQIGKGGVSIQLYHAESSNAARIERFLSRAKGIDKLSEIFIVPVKIYNQSHYRILYGAYTNSEAARAGMKAMPQRYKDAFAVTIYELDE
ncbi:MAG: AAA family ATPase [Gallionellaceae bacterium]|nr:AAA family ATPase [Gallionellaceae bacterium]